MVGIVVVARAAVLIARHASTWTVDKHLNAESPACVAVDRQNPAHVYCGIAHAGLFRSCDSGRHWASSMPVTTAVSSDQMMQDGPGRRSTSLGLSPRLEMAWRRLPGLAPHGDSDPRGSYRRLAQPSLNVAAAALSLTHEEMAQFDGAPC